MEPIAESAVRLSRVGHTYRSRRREVEAIAGIDLDVEVGSFVSLLGPSGCGKSTILRLVAGLLEPTTGEVAVLGATPARARRDKHIGWVPQSPSLLPWRTAESNVALPLQVNRRAGAPRLAGGAANSGGEPADPRELLDQVGLGAAAGMHPHELSGGMAQRVALARALSTRPSLLLMDEPFSALDELTRESLRSMLARLWGKLGTTVLFVTHSVNEAIQLSDEVVVLSRAPCRVVEKVEVRIPRPREAGFDMSGGFAAAERRIRSSLDTGRVPLAQ